MIRDDAMQPDEPAPDEVWIPELRRQTRELLADPEFRKAHESPRDTRWGSALPRYLRNASEDETGPTWIRPLSRLIRRYLRHRIASARVREFAKLNGWKPGKPFVLEALTKGKRSWCCHGRHMQPSQFPVGEGPYSRFFQRCECFNHNGIPVAVVTLWKYAPAELSEFAGTVGLQIHEKPPAGKYWPQNGNPASTSPTIAFTRPGTVVRWAADEGPGDFSPDSPEFVAEMARLEAELDHSGPTHNA